MKHRRLKLSLIGIIIISVTVVNLYLEGQFTVVTCCHPEPAITQCGLEEKLLGIIPLTKQVVPDCKRLGLGAVLGMISVVV